ncbi:MAG: tRNA preQ1(34) S-adenosylmethionine ribosyltransferase-isomerase QueA [Candidatus Omnitrophica bacterium]|nr:tRNA preQ1(34) S-adenosylmethionine ribosyltransferase-isomerase QueA [Candidatus Omnitrophota bacterium]MDD5081404.1 tRNA preQ1(34) S-adenosylmethionine ribosyltransferase-isomerase QueA [Candidatus Omnitrophota bacterium]
MNEDIYNLENYNYELPSELIAQTPIDNRTSSRLLVLERLSNRIYERKFNDIIDLLKKDDCLVLNNTKVIKARIIARKSTGAKIEVFLINKIDGGIWEVLIKPVKRIQPGMLLSLEKEKAMSVEIIEKTRQGWTVRFVPEDIEKHLDKIGMTPLPPYIKVPLKDSRKYQTVYAQKEGAVAAPTAGMHFDNGLLEEIKQKGVNIVYITLHCGLGTFRPVTVKNIKEHTMHSEWIEVDGESAEKINIAKKNNNRVIAVGTTAIRTLETLGFQMPWGFGVKAYSGPTNKYITPGYEFKIVDAVLTNFHTPCSTNLVLISAFCGYSFLMRAYQSAISGKFRFFSFGDAMFII